MAAVFAFETSTVNIETKTPNTPESVRILLANTPGVKVLDEPQKKFIHIQISEQFIAL
jgi:aspartate-semialdehyde dehydrogenase